MVALHEAPGDEGTCHSAVAIRKGMDLDLHKPVVVPRRHQKGVVNVGLGTALAVPVQEVIEFGVHMFGRAVLVDNSVGPGGIVGQRLEGAVFEASVEPTAELVHGPVGELIGTKRLVEAANGRAADGSTFADFTVDGLEGGRMVLLDEEISLLHLAPGDS